MTETVQSLAKTIWWMVLLRGILAIVFGILALLAPAAAITGMAIVFGVYALIDGVAEIGYAVSAMKGDPRRGWLIAQGVIGVLAGLAALIFPGLVGVLGGLYVLWTIAIYSVVHGIAGISSTLRSSDGGKPWGVVAGVVSILFGVLFAILILVIPGASLLSLIWVAGIWAVMIGIVLVVLAFRVRSAAQQLAG